MDTEAKNIVGVVVGIAVAIAIVVFARTYAMYQYDRLCVEKGYVWAPPTNGHWEKK